MPRSATPAALLRRDGRDDRVDDQRADVGDARGQEARHEGQQREREREPPAGGPDEVEGVPRVLEHLAAARAARAMPPEPGGVRRPWARALAD